MRLISLAIPALLLSMGCEQHDLGKECPQLGAYLPTDSATRIETAEVVEQNFEFPCDELVCVASEGRTGYCSRECREDANCPAGFECRQVQELGAFAGKKFCVWKRCDRPKDCGSHEEFRCCHPSVPGQCGGRAEGLSTATGEEIKLCTFRE